MSMEQSKKHSYGGRTCMACGGMSCKISYEQLRDMVEKRRTAPMAGEVSGEDAGPSIAKGQMQPLGHLAHGGSVAAAEDAPDLKGINKGKDGMSRAGMDLRGGALDSAKMRHGHVLEQMKSMPKPHGNYDQGGLAHDPTKYDDKGNRLPQPSQETPTSSEAHAKDQLANAFGHAKGGEIEGMDDDDAKDHDMVMDQCAHECMEAMKKGDKAAFKDALHAMMADFMSKMGED